MYKLCRECFGILRGFEFDGRSKRKNHMEAGAHRDTCCARFKV